MPRSFQQQSLQRKLIYLSCIVALFVATLIVRRFPASVDDSGKVRFAGGVDAQAQRLEIREESLGEVELTGSTVRLLLTGSRGLVVCVLWVSAQDLQKKDEWNKLELVVKSLTKLQPHFITPWMFQSWNLAYNVSVEADRVKDKYFYITRGIQLLAEGERKNRENPDLRHHIGIYNQAKISRHDEHNTLRSLFQLSCIDPALRQPSRFRQRAGAEVNLAAFKEFCEDHPHLVRRLREDLHCQSPGEVVDWLEANERIPSRFLDRKEPTGPEQQTPFKPRDERFPVLPPQSLFDPSEVTHDAVLRDDFDDFTAARAWFGYAQDPLLTNPYRLPRYMQKVIFQGYPARAQHYLAERRSKEGWFDEGWEILAWFDSALAGRQPVEVGRHPDWHSKGAWERAFRMYEAYGRQNRLLVPDRQREQLLPQQQSLYQSLRDLTNYSYFYHSTKVERTDEAIQARKHFHKAERLRQGGDWSQAVDVYEHPAAFGKPETWPKDKATGWKRIFLNNPEFRRDLIAQEETFVLESRYLYLLQERRGPVAKPLLVLQDYLAQAAGRPPAAPLWLPPIHVASTWEVPFKGPFEDVVIGEDGKTEIPLISEEARINVRFRLPQSDPAFRRSGQRLPAGAPPR